MRLSLHQSIALWWLLTSGFIFGPALAVAQAVDAGAIVAYGVFIVAVTIMSVPLLLRWPLFKRWFCWTDALSAEQRHAWERRELRSYYQIAFKDGYVSRLVPYLWRIVAVLVIVMAIETVIGQRAETPLAKAVSVFLSWYPMGAAITALLSAPFVQILQRRFQQNRQ